jgi:aspartyl-tRNA synthetase
MDAMLYYSKLGYIPLDVPLVIDEDVSALTKPEDVPDLYHKEGVYIGSAEQSFLQLAKDGRLSGFGKYFAITPCYRPEKTLDDSHYLVFLKIELFVISDDEHTDLGLVIDDAYKLFNKQSDNIKIQKMLDDSFDIMVNDIEVGSYGIRQLNRVNKYIYGTGLAEPRFSYALLKK